VVPEAFGIDMVFQSAADMVINPADIYNLHHSGKIPKADVVFSSHCLEHLCNPTNALASWAQLLKPMGLIILYLPDGDFYDNKGNREHVHDWKHETFLAWLKTNLFNSGRIIEAGLHVGEGLYSFYVVLEVAR